MTLGEAHQLRALIARLFPAGQRDPAPAEHLVDELADVPLPVAETAARSLARTGREWAPSPAQLRAHALTLRLDLPDWGAVVGALHARRRDHARQGQTSRWTCPHGECSGDGIVVIEGTRDSRACRCRADVLAARRTQGAQHPALAAWLATTPHSKIAAALDGDTTAEAQLRESWRDWCRDLTAVAAHQGLDPAGLPALERAAAGRPQRDTLAPAAGGMRDLVDRLAPAARQLPEAA